MCYSDCFQESVKSDDGSRLGDQRFRRAALSYCGHIKFSLDSYFDEVANEQNPRMIVCLSREIDGLDIDKVGAQKEMGVGKSWHSPTSRVSPWSPMDCSTIDVVLHLLTEPVFKVEDMRALYSALLFVDLLEVNRDNTTPPIAMRVKRLTVGLSQISTEAQQFQDAKRTKSFPIQKRDDRISTRI